MTVKKAGFSAKKKTTLIIGAVVLAAAALLIPILKRSVKDPVQKISLPSPEAQSGRLKAGEMLKVEGYKHVSLLSDGSKTSISFDLLAIEPKKMGPVILGKLKTINIDGLLIVADYLKENERPIGPFEGITQQLISLENNRSLDSLKGMLLMEITLNDVEVTYRLDEKEFMSLKADTVRFQPSKGKGRARGDVRLLYDGKTYRSSAADWDAKRKLLLFQGQTQVSYGSTVETRTGVELRFQPQAASKDGRPALSKDRKRRRKSRFSDRR